MTDDFWKDAKVIDVYTDEQAVDDGVLIPVEFGEISRVTRAVLDDFERDGRINADKFFKFMKTAKEQLEAQRKEKDDWFYSATIEGRKYFICENGNGFTLMKPEDY